MRNDKKRQTYTHTHKIELRTKIFNRLSEEIEFEHSQSHIIYSIRFKYVYLRIKLHACISLSCVEWVSVCVSVRQTTESQLNLFISFHISFFSLIFFVGLRFLFLFVLFVWFLLFYQMSHAHFYWHSFNKPTDRPIHRITHQKTYKNGSARSIQSSFDTLNYGSDLFKDHFSILQSIFCDGLSKNKSKQICLTGMNDQPGSFFLKRKHEKKMINGEALVTYDIKSPIPIKKGSCL